MAAENSKVLYVNAPVENLEISNCFWLELTERNLEVSRHIRGGLEFHPLTSDELARWRAPPRG